VTATEKWSELQALGKATFILRERGLIIGVPVGVVCSAMFNWNTLVSWRSWFTADFLIPALVGVAVTMAVGLAEWDETRGDADREARPQA
jgi:hypothetical protein